MSTFSFRTRFLTWVLLALLIALILLLVSPTILPAIQQTQMDSNILQLIGIAIALVVLTIGMVLIRILNKRLAQLAAVATALGQGRYDSRADDDGSDAIGRLARAINGMAVDIQNAVTQLQAQQSELHDNRLRLEEQNTQLSLQAKRLEQANRELLQTEQQGNQFVANLSQELRTPLNSIIGFSGIMMKNSHRDLSKKNLECVEKINRNGKHLLNLINDILTLSEIKAGWIDIDLQPVDVVVIAEETLETLRAQARASGLNLALETAQKLPQTNTDGDKLKQVLINLISNAIKFTRQGGVKVNIRKSGSDYLCIDVIDTGMGIPEDKLESVFEPFRQAESGATPHRYSNTGLGLAISQAIVDRLGGKLALQSLPGEGSMLTVKLPLGDVAADAGGV